MPGTDTSTTAAGGRRAPRRRAHLSEVEAAAWAREIRHGPGGHMSATAMQQLLSATKPIAAELAAAMVRDSAPLADGRLRMDVPVHPDFRDSELKPGQLVWPVVFDPRDDTWSSPGARGLGLVALASHVARVSTGRRDPYAGWRWLLSALGLARLRTLDKAC